MARRFRFPLETLLKVRRLYEREAKRKVATQQAEIARLDQLNRATQREISVQQAALLECQQQGSLSPGDLSRGRAWIAHLRHTIAQRQLLRVDMVNRLVQRQAEFRDARQQTRIIDKLRERRRNDYLRDYRRQEQAAADELAQQLHSFARSSPPPSERRRPSTILRNTGTMPRKTDRA